MKTNYNKQLYKETFDEVSASDSLKGKMIYMNTQNNKSNQVQAEQFEGLLREQVPDEFPDNPLLDEWK